MAFISSNPILSTLNLTELPTQISSAITEIRFGNGQGEFSLDPNPVLLTSTLNAATEIFVNINTQQYTTEKTDALISLGQLTATFPNVRKIHLDIGWYVNSLNCSQALIQPGVTSLSLDTNPYEWQVAGTSRVDAYLISQSAGLPAFRGTPADQALLNFLLEASAMGIDVAIYLILIPDIPMNNSLLNPYSNNGTAVGQDVYPQGSLVTVSPAQGYTGTAWGTSEADTQVSAFFGTETAQSYTCTFSTAGVLTSVYNNPVLAYSYSNFVIYYASLIASFVSTFSSVTVTDFIIGKNLVGLTSSQGASGNYQAVNELASLAEEVAGMFKNFDISISYSADWNEWQGTQNETSVSLTAPATRIFNMDPLWSSPYISYISICATFPVTDWRNFGNNLDGLYYPSSTTQPYVVEGLLGQQYYDYFYASSADRLNQVRTNIVGPTPDTTWIYQLKNFDSWIENYHYDFNGSDFSGAATSWVPNSKKIYLQDVQCPSVNLGTNEPDAYLHMAGSDYSLPYFSNGTQDLNVASNFYSIYAAYYSYLSPAGNIGGWSAAYWDERPYPWYPLLTTQWLDCADYTLGQCLNNKTLNIDPTKTYNQYINYNLLMTEKNANNPYWVTLVQSMDTQWNNLVNSSVNELQNIRNVNVIEDELKAANVRQMGFVVPDYGLEYFQYDNLMRYLGTFYLTRGQSKQFINFVSFFSQIQFSYISLYADGLNYNTLTSTPGELITQTPAGTWIPTPFYDVSYNPSLYTDVNENLYRQLLVQAAPIYLVLRNFVGEVFFTPAMQYLSSGFIELDIETAPLWPSLLPPPGLYELTLQLPTSVALNVPFTVTGTTLGATDSVSVSMYKTNNLTLILANRVKPLGTFTGTAVNNVWTVTATVTQSQGVYAVVTDMTEVTRNKTISLNEVMVSPAINSVYVPLITQTGSIIVLENGYHFAAESTGVSTLSVTSYPASANMGSEFTVTGTTYVTQNPVQVAMSLSNTVKPTSGFVSASVSGTTWNVSLISYVIGSYFVWAQLTADSDIFVVGGPIDITMGDSANNTILDRNGNSLYYRDGTPITTTIQGMTNQGTPISDINGNQILYGNGNPILI